VDKTQAAQKFRAIYVRALTDTENGKSKPQRQKDSDYAQVDYFINDLKSAKDTASLEACLAEYLKIYLKYSPDDRRSKMAFFHLLDARVNLSVPEDNYLTRLSADLASTQQPFTPTRQRFDGLEPDQKGQIKQLLKYKESLKKQHASIFDELREAYEKSSKVKKPTNADFYTFNPAEDPALEKSLRAILSQCLESWQKCEKRLTQENWDDFSARFKAFTDFLAQYRGEKLKLFQILKWLREPFIPQTKKTVPSGGRTRTETIRTVTSTLQKEFYFQAVYAIYMRAVLLINNVVYQYGFPKTEIAFFLDPLTGFYYYSNYDNRLRQGSSNAAGFLGTSVGFLWLSLFSQSHDVWLINDQKFHEIAKLYDEVVKASDNTPARQPKTPARKFSTAGKTTWQFAKGTFKIGNKQGAGQNESEIVYFEGENSRNLRIYIEFTRMRGPLFEVNLDQFLKRQESTPYELIWEANKGLIRLIAEYFGFLFVLFFPGVGYFGVFLELGFTGVLRQVVEQELIDQVIERLTENSSKSSGTGGPDFGAFDWISILLSGRKAAGKLASKLERDALDAARSDSRLLDQKATQLLGAGETDASRQIGDDVEKLGVKVGPLAEEKPPGWKPLTVVQEPPPVSDALQAARQTPKAQAEDHLSRLGTPTVVERNVMGQPVQTAAYEPELLEQVRVERAHNTDLSLNSFGRNVVAIEVEVGGAKRILVAANVSNSDLAERYLQNEFEKYLAKTGQRAKPYNELREKFRKRMRSQLNKFQKDLKDGFHSELMVEAQLEDLSRQLENTGNRGRVLQLYSEREPCTRSCKGLIAEKFKGARVFYTLPEDFKHQLDEAQKQLLRDQWLGKTPRPKPDVQPIPPGPPEPTKLPKPPKPEDPT